jgi:sugar O-acyltransferase (sialic acid O-acetyltransferase NeuD family)
MHTEMIYVVGAGGHAAVVVDALLVSGISAECISVSDGDERLRGTLLLGIPVQVPALRPEMLGGWFHVAIGTGALRQRLHEQLLDIGARPRRVLHPAAIVSPFASLGEAVFVAARALVAPEARVDDGAIINHGAVVDHHCTVGRFAHVAPNATLAGAVCLGSRVLIGAGANVLPGINIGDDAVIGAGAVVLNNVLAGQVCAGVPAISLDKE